MKTLSLVLTLILIVLSVASAVKHAYLKGCTSAFTDIYTELGLKTIDQESLAKHCADRLGKDLE